MLIKYVEWNPQGKTISIVDSAVAIAEEYNSQGYTLTLRQLYYQFVSKGLLENTEAST